MEKAKKIFGDLAFITLLIFLAYIYTVSHSAAPQTIETRTEKIFVYDSTKKTIPVITAPGTVSFYPVALPAKLDTAAIGAAIRNYFAAFTYSQTIQDSSVSAMIFDSISQNRVMGRRFQYKLLKPVRTIETTTVTVAEKPATGFYAGLFTDLRQGHFGFGPKISIETKNNWVLGYDYDALQHSSRISIQTKIKWKQR